MDIFVLDEATPWLEYMSKALPGFQRKALKSAGWWMSKEIKEGIRSKSPGGKRYPAFMKAKKRRALEQAFGGEVKRSYRPMGGLTRAIGYQYIPSQNAVVVGWLGESAARLGLIMEKGTSHEVTEEMRRGYAAAGFPLKPSTKKIKIPARPTINPMAAYLGPKIPDYVEDKIWEYEKKGAPRYVRKTKRKYKVTSKFM